MEIRKYAELTDRRTRVGAIKKGRCASKYSKSISINLYKIERMLSFCCESGGSADGIRGRFEVEGRRWKTLQWCEIALDRCGDREKM